MEEAKKPMNGLLRVNVVFARGLKIADKNSSDPYCEIHFPDKKSVLNKKNINKFIYYFLLFFIR